MSGKADERSAATSDELVDLILREAYFRDQLLVWQLREIGFDVTMEWRNDEH